MYSPRGTIRHWTTRRSRATARDAVKLNAATHCRESDSAKIFAKRIFSGFLICAYNRPQRRDNPVPTCACRNGAIMLHFSCDLCSRPLDEQRFVVRLESYPAFDPERLEEADLDHDHLQEVADVLDHGGALDGDLEANGAKVFRFDLCPQCYCRFLKDPLGREAVRRLKFSNN